MTPPKSIFKKRRTIPPKRVRKVPSENAAEIDDPREVGSSPSSRASLSAASSDASNVIPITCHVLDTSSGLPAAGLSVSLHKMSHSVGTWVQLNKDITNSDGRLPGFTKPGSISSGIHKMRFETEEYFRSKGSKTFYPYVEVVFNIEDEKQHYHVPLLLSPYGYSTYRGS